MAKIIKMTVDDDLIKIKLNEAFTSWVSNNEKISNLVKYHDRLILYVGNGTIEINLGLFPDDYVYKYFTGNKKLFCDNMVKSLEQTVFKALIDVSITDYRFHFSFQYYGVFVSKDVNYYLLTKMT